MEPDLCGPCDIGENTPCTCGELPKDWPKEAPSLDDLEDAGQIPLFDYSEKDPISKEVL